MAQSELIKTGISSLDSLFKGGILQGNVILVEGAPGSGKTLFGTEFIYRGIVNDQQPGMIVVFEVSPDKLIRDAAGMGWDLAALQDQQKLRIIYTSPQVLFNEMRSPDSLLLEAASEIGAQRIFIDGISLLRAVSNGQNHTNGNDLAAYRETLQQLIEGIQRENLTAVISHELGGAEDQKGTLEVAEFLSDTVILLQRKSLNRGIRRVLQVVKSRGQEFDEGEHTLQITNGKGLEVYRRVQARPVDTDQPTSGTQSSVVGVDALDNLIGGGIFDGSMTMVTGISGAGKTILGVQLLVEGARKQNKRGLMVSLDEHSQQILRNADTLGLNLREHVEAGDIHVLYDCPQELEIDVHYHRIIETLEKHNIERLVIDGMTSYSIALQDTRLYRDFFHALVHYCKQRLITAFFNYENAELFGINTYMPEYGVSSIVDNIIMLNFVEIGDTMRRAITVAKTRGTPHHFQTREYVIGEGGILLVPLDDANRLPVLPFSSYYGLVSRAPTRFANREAIASGHS